ncbi:MAG TPA: hypothetical protein VJR89_29050 [Polyangiales bacterium]|nr:hypothetical protein [Polyangiales bacterium]
MVTTHLARFELERMAAEDPDAKLGAARRVHVGGCDLCQTRLRALLAARVRFLNSQPAAMFAHDTLTRAELLGPYEKVPWWVGPQFVRGVLAVLALGVAVLAWFAHDAAATWSDSFGGASFRVIAKRGEHESPLRDGDSLGPADRLAFEYSLQRAQHFMLLGIDETGTIRRYLPRAGTGASDLVLRATPHARLPGELELVPQRGDERLYAFFSSRPIAESAARKAIASAAGAAWANGDGLTKTPQPRWSSEWSSVWLRKVDAAQHELTLR